MKTGKPSKTYSQYNLRDLYDIHSNKFDWLLKGVVLPEVFLQDEQIVLLLNKRQITNPIDLLKVYCNIKIERPIHCLKKLYSNVFCNPIFNTKSMIGIAIKVIRVASNMDYAIDDILDLSYKYKFNSDFRTLVERAIVYEKLINVHWSEKRISNELKYMVEPDSVNYIEELNLPSYASLISTHVDLVRESVEMNNCLNAYWNEIKERKCFIQFLGPHHLCSCHLITRRKYRHKSRSF